MDIIRSSSRILNHLRRLDGNKMRILQRQSSTNPTTNPSNIHKLHPVGLNRKILLWTGKFKNDSEIPELIGNDVMEKAKSRFRIKVSNYGMALTVVFCLIYILRGKRAAERGESVHQMNVDWHTEINKKHAEEKAAEAKK